MAFIHNDIATKQRLRDALNEEGSMGFEHNDIVTVDVMNAAISAGGGGGGTGTVWHITFNSPAIEGNSVFIPAVTDMDAESNDVLQAYPIVNGTPYYGMYYGLDSGATDVDISYEILAESVNISIRMSAFEGFTPSVTGDVEFIDDDGWAFNITGDGTITITAA